MELKDRKEFLKDAYAETDRDWEEQLENDEISAEEEAFMRGYEE